MTSILAPFHTACPSCGSSFEVDPDRLPDEGIHAVCSACLRTFRVELPAELRELRPDIYGAFGPPTPAAEAERERPVPDVEGEPEPVSLAPEPESQVSPLDSEEPWSGLAEPDAPDAPQEAAEFEILFSEDEVRDVAAIEDDPVDFELVEEFPDAPPVVSAPESAADFEIVDELPEVGEASDSAVPTAAPPKPGDTLAPPPPGIEDLSSLADEVMSEDPASTTPRPSLSEGRARFGRRDPRERARRLARVLVSDIIAYYPEKHAEALRRGTVREEFEEEVLKSWTEYVDQVGSELAEETPFFREALNEVLAGGRQLY